MQIDVQGDGAPLVLVGGGLTGWRSWEPHQARLRATRQAVRAQPLAVQWGLEDRSLPVGYSLAMEAAALDGVLTGLGAPVDLVGWSYGAQIALGCALAHPDRIRTLTLIEPPAFWVLSATGRLDAEAQRESDALRALYAGMASDVSEDQLAAFVGYAGLCPPGKSPRQLPQWALWVEHRRSLRTADASWAQTGEAALLRAFAPRVLLVKGTGSSHFFHQIIDGLAATLPRAELVELPAGHAPQLVSMDAFLARLEAFVGGSA